MKRSKKLLALYVALLFGLFFSVSSSAQEAARLSRASVCFRIPCNIWTDDARFAQLLEILGKYPGIADELTFFTQKTHTPIPDDELERRCVLLKQRIAEAHARGYRAGINLMCTLGHHPENVPHSIGPEFPRAQTMDGGASFQSA